MAYTTINKSTDYFNTKLYTGNYSTNVITGVGFQSDMTWIKSRSSAQSHVITDAVRGITKNIYPNSTDGQDTVSSGITAFGSDGFTLGANNGFNENSATFASWNWKANGSGSANTDGSISSTVSANTTSGFSIVKYVSNGTAGATVGHGLGVAPKMVITFNLAGEDNWGIGHSGLSSWDYYLQFNTSAQANSQNVWNDTAPSTSLVTLGDNGRSNSSNNRNYIMYAFAEKQGYSKFGSYTGNNNDDGAFVYTGFKPAFVMVKITAGQTDNWIMQDNKINSFNGASSQRLRPNSSGAEFSSSNEIDLLSNGFKTHGNDGEINGSGFSYIYMAFGQSLVGTNNIPANAR